MKNKIVIIIMKSLQEDVKVFRKEMKEEEN